jgi:hypothetical protein
MSKPYYTESSDSQQSKTFLPLDIVTLCAGFSLILVGAVLYLYNPLATLAFRNLEAVAKVSRLEFESKRKVPGTLSWINTQPNDVLYNGDQILTDEQSSVVVSFDNGSQLYVGPQSLIKVEVVSNQYQIQLIKGQLRIEEEKGESPTKIIHSDTGQVAIMKKGEEFTTSKEGIAKVPKKLGYLENGEVNYLKSPKQGTVIDPNITEQINVQLTESQSGTLSLVNGDGVQVYETKLSNSKSTNIEMPSPGRYTTKLTSPEGKIIGRSSFKVSAFNSPKITIPAKTSVHKGEKIPIKWTGRSGINYILRITSPEGTTEKLLTTSSYDMIAKKSGVHVVEVSIMDGNTEYSGSKASIDLKVADGLIISNEQLNQIIPEKSVATLEVQNEVANKSLIFELSNRDDFSEIKKTFPAKGQIGSIVMEDPGIYYVRARTQDAYPLVSPIAKITVKTPVAKIDKRYQQKQAISESGVVANLRWNKLNSVKELDVQVAKDASFRDIIFEKTIEDESIKIELPSIGSYFWRTLPNDAPEFVSPSEVFPLQMELPAAVTVPRIIPQQILDYEDEDGIASYRIKIPEQKNIKMYFLEIFADAGATKLVWKNSSEKPVINWISNRSGKYYYRIKVQDTWGRTSNYSSIGELVFPISPLVEI